MNKISLILTLAIAIISSAHAESWVGNLHDQFEDVPSGVTLQQLSALTSDQDTNINYLNLMIDKNGLVAGMFNLSDPKNKPGSGPIGQSAFWLRDIESPKGVVLARARGRDALIMTGLLDRATQEGDFTIKYLANGLSMNYESCNFSLKRAADNTWWVKNAYTGEKVSNIHVTTWSLGITTVEGICPK